MEFIIFLLIMCGVFGIISGFAALARYLENQDKIKVQKAAEEKKRKQKEELKQEVKTEIITEYEKEQNVKKKKGLFPLVENLKSIVTCKDEISDLLESIAKTGHNVLFYQTENTVLPQIIDAYRQSIENCLKIAVSLAMRFRKAKNYLNENDYCSLEKEIDDLKQADTTCKATKKILDEKKALLQNVKNIKNAKEKSFLGLQEIDVTLKSLEASLMQVEVEAVSKSQVEDEIRLTISTLSSALDETFKELEEKEKVKEKY